MFSSKVKREKIYVLLYCLHTECGLVNRTALCLVLRVFSQALWQNWFLEVFLKLISIVLAG